MTHSKLRGLPSRAKRRLGPKNPRQGSPNPPRRKPRRFPILERLKRLENAPAWQWGRLVLVWGILAVGATGLAVNLYRLQITRAPELVQKARQQQMVYMRPFVPRRPIVDRKNNVLATDRLVYTLYAHPKLFTITKTEMAARLSKVLDPLITEAELLKKFDRAKSGIPIAYALKEESADKIADLSLDGLELIRQYSRLYPQQELVADVIGYVNVDHHGQAGLEYSQQKWLERNVLTLRLNRAGNGALMPDRLPEGFLNFDDRQLQLTLDLRVQRAARFALKQQVENFSAKRGAVIVMDVRDGAIVAMAAEPTYNPNQYSKFDLQLFKNWMVADLYEPGSTFKPINIAIALEEGSISPESVFNDSGVLYFDNRWEIKNHDFDSRGGRGQLNLSEILQYSSNVGMVRVMSQMPRQKYYQALQNLGIDQRMGIDLPGEAVGQLKGQKQFVSSPVEAATTAFGQGFSLTPLKLVQLQAAIANGGKLVTPHVVKGTIDGEQNLQWQPSLKPPRQVFSPENTQAVLEMMASVIDAKSGRNARIDGYHIAGKSGTAQKAAPTGGYYSNLKISSFVSILPVNDPRYVVLVVIDEPKGDDAYGSIVAAPVVKSVMEALISIEGLPPSQSNESEE